MTLNDIYSKLCQELGHLESNRKKIEAKIAEISEQIRALDKLAESGLSVIEKEPRRETQGK